MVGANQRTASKHRASDHPRAGQVLAKSVPCDGSVGDNQCSLRFFQSFPPESWRVRPRPGPFARDRASLSRRRFERGQAPARCVMRHPGVEACSSGGRFNAGHHAMLAPVVGIANIVQEVKTGSDTVTQDPNPLGPTLRAHRTLRSPLTLLLERASPPAASSRLRRGC